MALTIYRRHRKTCPYYRRARKARNTHACKAQCPIWVQGTLAGESIRRSLDLTYWEAPRPSSADGKSRAGSAPSLGLTRRHASRRSSRLP
jgi:hypothetical protein